MIKFIPSDERKSYNPSFGSMGGSGTSYSPMRRTEADRRPITGTVTAALLGDPPPDLAQRRQEALNRARDGKTLRRGSEAYGPKAGADDDKPKRKQRGKYGTNKPNHPNRENKR